MTFSTEIGINISDESDERVSEQDVEGGVPNCKCLLKKTQIPFSPAEKLWVEVRGSRLKL